MEPTAADEALYACLRCRKELFLSSNVIPHEKGKGQTAFSYRKRDMNASGECASLFVNRMDWMGDMGDTSGKFSCPKCNNRIGSYAWSGAQCACGTWVTPAVMVTLSKVRRIDLWTEAPAAGAAAAGASADDSTPQPAAPAGVDGGGECGGDGDGGDGGGEGTVVTSITTVGDTTADACTTTSTTTSAGASAETDGVEFEAATETATQANGEDGKSEAVGGGSDGGDGGGGAGVSSEPQELPSHPLKDDTGIPPFYPLLLALTVAPDGQRNFWDGVYQTELTLVEAASTMREKIKALYTWYGTRTAFAVLAVVGSLGLESDDKILDAGAGNGQLSLALAQAGFSSVVGADYSDAAVDVCRRLQEAAVEAAAAHAAKTAASATASGSGGGGDSSTPSTSELLATVQFVVEDLTEPTFEPGSFAAVVDKGTFDSVAMSLDRHYFEDEEATAEALAVEAAVEDTQEVLSTYLEGLATIISVGGHYIVVSSSHEPDELTQLVCSYAIDGSPAFELTKDYSFLASGNGGGDEDESSDDNDLVILLFQRV